MTLLILVLQGYIFSFLLFYRYFKYRNLSDICLAVLLFLQGHHCTAYIIGFMDWYDTFPTTKINYFLFDMSLAVGPLIYFYFKGLTKPSIKFRKIDWLHFAPAIGYFWYGIFVWLYDSNTAIYPTVQNGPWEKNISFIYVYPVMNVLSRISGLIYLVLTSILFINYRKKIKAFFSNTYKVELNWLGLFLGIYIVLYLIHFSLGILDNYIELTWTDYWWGFFAIALTVYIVGMKGYYTDLTKLHDFSVQEFDELEIVNEVVKESIFEQKIVSKIVQTELNLINENKERLTQLMNTEKPYLNPDLTLSELSKQLNLTPNFLSKVINLGFEKNFNEYINSHRVEAFKNRLQEGETHLSLLGMAYECGFNSKATFNRTFKKMTGFTPSQFNKTLSS
ncbi:MAG: helix-turn-helix domain-containing protein [Saprospiraceae bacterium]